MIEGRRRASARLVARAFTAMTVGVAARVGAQGVPQNETCVECHLGLEDERMAQPALDYETDVHAGAGFGCLECHGARHQESAPDPAAGFLGRPAKTRVAAACGRCHSDGRFMRAYDPALRVDQEAEYATSVHGERLARFGDPKVAVCVSCHPAHRVRPPSDNQSSVHPLNVASTCANCHADEELMAEYAIPTDQHRRYERSVHWAWMTEEEDLSAPTCNDCHGNHGAAPPGVESVQNVCGQCHSAMAELFTGGMHATYFAERALPGCATCHGNHDVVPATDEHLVTVADSVCARCHQAGEPGHEDFRVIKGLIDSLSAALARSHEILGQAENLGMEVTQAQFILEDVATARVKARVAVHAFAVDTVRQEVDAGLATAARAHARGQEALDEHTFRRQGLAVSVGLIVLLVVGLALKIRQLERRAAPVGPPRVEQRPE